MKYLMGFFSAFLIHNAATAACGDESTREFLGDEAITMTYILKNSSIAHKSTSGNVVTWTVSKLVCRQTNRGVLPDLMPDYKCSTPSGVGKITAKALFDAMSEMGVMPDGAAGHVYEQARTIKCSVNKNGSGGTSINPRCTMKAAWGDECG
ncbi:hypothetical protein QJS83_10010 [Bdellovibrio sp. 22V]|uniref:hypothetical protein n=1 Tax=Bdellovibrio sp. 22V TaxID=3044166 RepID=UPI00254309B8|nr:hypothetical protein [Bdellovibrio sp. 22V]WII70794.1 hypothetical protein QJS83_10010 [Bdellovibrio sp. 22V]